MRATQAAELSGWLDSAAWGRLETHLEDALSRCRGTGETVLASVTTTPTAPVDPVAVAAASRLPGEAWFCLEQPDRDGWALGALGTAAELRAGGDERPAGSARRGRFAAVQQQWRRLVAGACADAPDGPPGSGLLATGGFAFSNSGAGAPEWREFGAGSLLVPEIALLRQGQCVWLTLTVAVNGGDTIEELGARARAQLARLRVRELPPLDPWPAAAPAVRSVMPPAHYEEAVARAVQRICGGELEKVVLAREVQVEAHVPLDGAAVLGVLRDAFPACFVFAVGRGDTIFLGASPELLVRRQGARASTVALAGSTARSADPAVDDHLGERLLRSDKDRRENLIVARRIGQALAPHSVWVTVAPEPVVVKVANIQHLGTPIRAQLARSLTAVELAGLLHPTPAVGGEPWAAAEPLIPALEGFDRGWYAGPIGWTDATGDGEFCVALRCGLVHERSARLFAGAGIVRDSDPAAELAETEVKLQALLPVLAG